LARTPLVALAFVLLSWLPFEAGAGDVFTGFQIDNKKEYFAYLGIRPPLSAQESAFLPFVQVFAAGLGYSFTVEGQVRDASAQFTTPALGLKYTSGAWSLVGLAGPQFRWKQEDNGRGGRDTREDIGAFVQGETFYWHDQGNVHAIFSYTALDRFYWGRIRGKVLTCRPENGGYAAYLGWDATGMGNKDFHAELTGPLAELQVGRFFFLVRGGYQYTATFRSGTYSGFEIYFPF
jgi:hypothetical protein